MKSKIMCLALVLCMSALFLPVTAYAGGGDEGADEPEVVIITEPAPTIQAETETAVPVSSNPFTPDGTGTVLDNTTDGDGKEFFTITTPDENVYYLIIDRQKDTNNVYFLNAVTEADLLPLAEKDGSGEVATGSESAVPTPVAEPDLTEPDVETEPESETESSGINGTILFIILAVVAVGGAGYYFKILRPKQRATMPDDDYDEPEEEYEPYDEADSPDFGFDYEEDDIPFDDDGSGGNNCERDDEDAMAE